MSRRFTWTSNLVIPVNGSRSIIGPRTNGYGFVNAGSGKAANNPVQTVDWYDCVKWCNARSVQAGLTPVYYTDAGFTQGVIPMGR
jgi:formylglycine-generating enzyme required for sulfatase activity